ncbi:MAG: M13 family peptidase, partial [Verrucomicrobia bacterium]|nr:M13 family peptidase [Prolixibacteraceae bacterium]
MKQITRLLLISTLMGSLACTKEAPKNKSLDLADLDTLVSPAADFDQYANGGWKKRFPIPDEKSRFGSFDLLADTGEVQVRTLISEIAGKNQEAG